MGKGKPYPWSRILAAKNAEITKKFLNSVQRCEEMAENGGRKMNGKESRLHLSAPMFLPNSHAGPSCAAERGRCPAGPGRHSRERPARPWRSPRAARREFAGASLDRLVRQRKLTVFHHVGSIPGLNVALCECAQLSLSRPMRFAVS